MNKSANTPYFRRRFIVNRRLQCFLIFFVFAIGSCILSLNLFFYQVFIRQTLNLGSTFQNMDPFLLNQIADALDGVFLKLALTSASIMGVVTVVGGLFLSHRIAGPIYRIQKVLEAVNRDEKIRTPIRFRDGDFFREMEETINQLVQRQQGGRDQDKLDR